MTPPLPKRTRKRPGHLSVFVLDEDLDQPKKSARIDSRTEESGMEQKINNLMEMMTKMNTTISTTIQTTIDSKMTTINTDLATLKNSAGETSQQMQAMKTSVDANIVAVKNDIASVQANVTSLAARMSEIEKQVRPGGSTQYPVPQVGNLSTPGTDGGESATLSASQSSCSLSRRRDQKLIDLPVFDGDCEKWFNFISEFEDTTESEGYSTVQNNSRLKRCLTGNARDTVESMLIHHTNVPEVIERLRARFGRPEKIVERQLEIVKAIPPIPENKIELLVKFSDKVNNMTNVLKSCHSQHHLSNPILLKDLVMKLPLSKRWIWTEHQSSIQPFATIVDFNTWLNKTADLADLIPVPPAQLNKVSSEKNRNDRGRVLLVSDKSKATTTMSCSVCSKNHKTPDCPNYKSMDVDHRYQLVSKEKLCFLCLGKGHQARRCHKKGCEVVGCKDYHHITLHKETSRGLNSNAPVFQPPVSRPPMPAFHQPPPVFHQPPPPVAQPPLIEDRVMSTQTDSEANVLFKIVPITLYGPLGAKKTFALLDEASTLTLMNRDIANDLGLRGEKRTLSIRGIDNQPRISQAEVADVKISGTFLNAPIYEMKGVRIVDALELPEQTVDVEKLCSQFCNLKNLPIESIENGLPKILIGLNHAYLGAPTKIPFNPGFGPIPIMTKLGCILYGSRDRSSSCEIEPQIHRVLLTNVDQDLVELHNMIEEHYTIEDFGVKSCPQVESADDKKALEILEETTKRCPGGFESGLLWRRDPVILPSSYEMAVRRFLSVERKMKKDENYGKLYRSTINDYIKKGYARKMSFQESQKSSEKTWYLPHFGVVNPNKPEKFRLVFDGAATVKGSSLNSELLVGPDLNQPLLKILWRFREKEIGVCGDIREMYHQIKIRDGDVDSQRFLWRENPEAPIEKYQMIAMTFGSSSSPTTAQFVKNKNALEFSHRYPAAAKAIVECHYVDDYVCSYPTEEDAIQTTNEVVQIHKWGGFDLRNFISNSNEVAAKLNGESHTVESVSMDMSSEMQVDKVLGLFWKVDEDAFTFQLKFSRIAKDILTFNRRPTKREMLAIAMSIYDPFGLISNFTIHIKLLVQKIWKRGLSWDDQIPDSIYLEWKQWFEELEKVKNVRVPRCYSPSLFHSTKIELHTLVDASSVAFSAVCFLRIIRTDEVNIAFVGSKTKCAPIKELSIPRLELQAAVLGTRLSNTIKESVNFGVHEQIYWSDSMTVLYWLKDEKCRYKQFVRNRVSEVLDSSSSKSWRYVPSADNVADDATRDVYPPRFDPHSRWLSGPAWLLKEESWPKQPQQISKQSGDMELVCSSEVEEHMVMMSRASTFFIDVTKFSDYMELKRRIGWYIRFMNYYKAKIHKRIPTKGELLMSELNSAEDVLCRLAQKESFATEYASLQLKKPTKFDRDLSKLMPYLDSNGVMRVYGRVDNAPTLPVFTKRPIILAKNHHLSTLIVRYFHEIHKHQFDELTICEIRFRFWIVGVRTVLKKVKSSCPTCILRSATPNQPMMGQIPEDRLTPYLRPFSYTGVDYFGPIEVAIGRRREKRWVALFTCMTVRAVHVEISENLSSDSFILCLRNFINLRGVPVRLRSDNGTNFVGAKGEMIGSEDFFGEAGIQRECSKKGIEWKFNTPSDPAAGGIWERLVQSIKRVLKPLLKDVAPRVETLRSFLLEATNIVNSRPLTHLPMSSEDELPLTPNHFLIGCPNSIQTIGSTDEKLWCLRKQWRISQALKNHFWGKFIRDYLPTLTRREKWCSRAEPLKPGDVVLICDDNVARGEWKKGIVEEVITAKDGQTRSALVKTSGSTLRRPASKLAVLDIVGRS